MYIGEFVKDRDRAAELIGHLESIRRPDFDVRLPAVEDLPQVLLDLAVPHEDIDGLVAQLPSPERDPRTWRLLEYVTHAVVRPMGAIEDAPPFQELAPSMGILRRYFYVYVFLAALPHVQDFHRGRGIPEDVSRSTLADLGRCMADHHYWYGVGGLDAMLASWLRLHFSGAIYQLGRLQFQRARLGNRTGQGVSASGLPYGPGDHTLEVHIPAWYGPLTPDACERSLAAAREFFPRFFPAEECHVATCHSWLLDSQLAEYLPADSNIVRFQRRFRLAHESAADDADTLRFVFGRIGTPLDQLPRETRLQRAILDHLKAGRHWHGGGGWFALDGERHASESEPTPTSN